MSLVPRLFSEFAQTHPQLDILFTEMKPDDGLRAAATRQVDLAVVDDQVSPGSMAGSLELHPLCVDHYGVAVAASHSLAGKSSVRLSELARERWAMGRDGVAHYKFLMSACYASGFTPHVVSKCGNMAARLELVRTGTAVTILPWLALRVLERDPDFRLIPVYPTLTRQIFAVLPRGSSRRPAVATVLRALQRLAKKVTRENKGERNLAARLSPGKVRRLS
jgi:DNA-binding transcriptional LysR family regulator